MRRHQQGDARTFFQLSYCRSQSSFSDGGLPVGAAREDLGSGARSQIGTSEEGVRYLDVTEGQILRMGLDENDEVIAYEFVNIGKMMAEIANGVAPDQALAVALGTYGRFGEAVRTIDPRRSSRHADQITEKGVTCNG